MKTLAAFFLIPFCAAAAANPADVESLVTAARALPPEFAAEALIRLSGVDALPAARRVEILQEAFQKAGQAQLPYQLRSALMGLPAAAAFLSKVNRQELDALDLRARAIQAMLPLDAARARKLLQSLPSPKIEPLKCDDFMVPDVDRFYQALGAAVHSFPDTEKRSGAAARFLMPFTAVTSAVEVGPMAAVLADSGVDDAGLTALLKSYGAAIARIKGDDRAFSASYVAGTRMETLVAECKRRKVSPLPLLEGYRQYLVANLSGPRCADDDRMQGGLVLASSTDAAAANQAIDVASFFNQKLRVDPLQPISEGESTPSRLEGAATGLRTCVDEQCGAVTQKFRELVFGAQGMPVPPSDRETQEWRDRLRDLLTRVEAWQPGDRTSPAEHFREKVLLYNDLLSVAPSGDSRDGVLRSELQFLLKNRDVAANRAEWFLPLNVMLARATLDPAGYGAFRAEMQKSDDPVVSLYARLEAVAPRPVDRVMPLL